ncbi:uncharacterized protein LOC130975312 [Arachis stenosperma]|uniref:uncharacterized protein LOC130975312 n=1 Tax=Arachis stenosperma TaxID=217475 RepID=UPI0025ACA6EB|nr:uncharacterized protein LOC130975312 [Arachis stenosperma]
MEDSIEDATIDAEEDFAPPPMQISYEVLDGITQDAGFLDDDDHESCSLSDEIASAINKEKNKVVFGEAGKDFVDVLFSFLTLPLGTIARLVAKEEKDLQPVKVGSLSSLYSSVANLDESEYLTTETCKEMLLQPRNSMEPYIKKMKLNIDDTKPTTYYVCNNIRRCRHHQTKVEASTFSNKQCSYCGELCAKTISPLFSADVFDGFVKSGVAFLISDELKVVPISMDAMCDMFKDSGTDDMRPVEQVTVNVTKKQVLELLKISLVSKTTLSYAFLEKKPSIWTFLSPIRLFDIASKGGSSSKKIEVKVVQRKSDSRILFVQGKKDFADMLYSFLTFPLGAVVKLLEGNSCMGSMDALYNSIVGLSEDYFVSKEVKDMLVSPLLAPQFKLSNQIIPLDESHAPTYYFDTALGYHYLSTCRGCEALELDMFDPTDNGGSEKGFAKGPTLYFATDDLIVTPMLSISIISPLNSTNTPICDLVEKMVSIGSRILKASLTTTSALTTGLNHLFSKVKEEK